jgi:RNA polymerase sigma-70 factor, ECF subfamily
MSEDFSEEHVTDCLKRASLGDAAARDEAYRIFAAQLRQIAEAKLRRDGSALTLQATCLVNDAFFKLIRNSRVHWNDRQHFLIFAAREMRTILVDHARRRRREKRGFGIRPVDVAEVNNSADPYYDMANHERVLAVEDAMSQLRERHPRFAEIVELKFFGGYSFSQMAVVLGTPESTLKSQWTMAKVLLRELLNLDEVHE